MNERVDFRRTPLYYHVESDYFLQLLGRESWIETIAPIIEIAATEPSLVRLRTLYGDMLCELYTHPEIAFGEGYSRLEIATSIAVLQNITTRYGLILGSEVDRMHTDSSEFKLIDPVSKYATWDDIVKYSEQSKRQGKIHGIVHGAFDPPHIGHGETTASVWPHCDQIFVGFDKNTLLRKRKGDNRPRFPQLGWRMWEIASLPTVDKVFVIPFDEVDPQSYLDLYKELRIQVIGTSEENPHLAEYQAAMNHLGGKVITRSRSRSSTELIDRVVDDRAKKHYTWDITLPHLRSQATNIEQKAIRSGYLRDYPNGT